MSNPEDESPLVFPCDFPIKAMGHHSDELQAIVVEIVRRHAPELPDEAVRSRPSSNGKYLSITVTVRAQNRDQLDAIYMDLTGSQHILMAL